MQYVHPQVLLTQIIFSLGYTDASHWSHIDHIDHSFPCGGGEGSKLRKVQTIIKIDSKCHSSAVHCTIIVKGPKETLDFLSRVI